MRLAILFLPAVLFAGPPPDEAAADFALGRWDELYARFSPRMRAAIAVEKLRAVAAFGKCQTPTEPPTYRKATPEFDTHIYKIVCERKTVGISLTTNAAGQIEGLFFVEPPAAPTGFEVVTGEYHLPARLTLPEGAGPFPAVVLVHGSGPHDMDETIGPNKPFRDIAEGLAARGIASLRYTKRTKQYGASMTADTTVKEETIQDALSAVRLLRANVKINPERVYVLGHSLGAYVAPRIGEADPALAGLILLAGNTRPMDVLIDEQIRYLGGTGEQAAALKNSLPEAYRKDLANYHPVATANSLKIPMLILQGERDYQVTLADFAGWQKLKSQRVTLKSYPALNHLFQEGTGKSLPAEYGKSVPFSAGALADIANWILR